MNPDDLNTLINEVISSVKNVTGIDLVYFLDKNQKIIKEQKYYNINNYYNEVLQLIKSTASIEIASKSFYTHPFHTFTFLNEDGLLVITKLDNLENLYMVIVAGENESVDLISLLKKCKETRLKYQDSILASL